MSRKIIHTVVLAALAGFSALALAEDPPAIVGRISSVEGQVTLVGDGDPVGASLNWPVTAANHINTANGARTEFRVGSTAVRVDGDSDLEITAMDDDLLRLRLNYGSVSIRVRNPDLLRDFELTTPQARITLLEPGILRVDVDRQPDTSQISLLAGSARVDGAGSSVVVSNGRHVDVTGEDVRTSVARRDGFDIWSEDRDRYDNSTTTRFVSSGMTGYEELDRNGTWIDNPEYGPLWTPRNVALDWAPYRDGRWIWLAPWGWTWVDNAPWGYAPSHYGRWVMVGRRWSWAPGRPAGRPVWAPALVGWVGGNGGGPRPGPGLGWYPLSPRDRFVPGYRVSADYDRRVTWTHNGKPFTPRDDWNGRRNGLTVLPRDQFEGRRNVVVNRGAQVIPPASFVKNVGPVAPPQPPGRGLTTNRGGGDRDHDGIPDRFDRNDGRNDRPGRVITAPSQPVQVPAQQPRGQISTLAPNQFGHPDAPAQTINPNDVRIELRPRFNQPGQQGQPGQQQGQPGQQPRWQAPVTPQPVLQVAPQQPQQTQQQQQPQWQAPRERTDRGDDNRRFRPHDEQRPQQQAQPQQPQVQPQQPQPAQQPPRQFTPPPQQQQPQQQPQRAEPRREAEKPRDEKKDPNRDRRENRQ
ncbi:DUF6600 domain-containing protein [Duganella levis]|uniref:FecR protein domain-containing protein n=1 Tax=Duganella levis TaxID=2692169 RepID=A0ABW9W1Y6_9BURK|nr:DUF6600 domain-containing protein [Duganella levis]MYN27777.1 hypothetical protein [Duganella levis]